MTKRAIAITVLCVLNTAFADSTSLTWQVSGKVTKVHDGDSIHITPSGHRKVIIRLSGIDAPEIEQDWGTSSRDVLLRSAIMNKEVVAHCHKRDRYDRSVCVVFRDGIDVNYQLVSAGLAWVYEKYKNEMSKNDRVSYSLAQNKAKASKIGLWSAPHIEPWIFRKLKK